MNHQSSKRENPSNLPSGGDVFTSMLDAMSVSELKDALNHTLEELTEENYNPALIEAYLDALGRKNLCRKCRMQRRHMPAFKRNCAVSRRKHALLPTGFAEWAGRLWQPV